MNSITITPEMKYFAREYSDKCIQSIKSQGKTNYTGLTLKDSYYNGFLGEFVFKEYLNRQLVHYDYMVHTDGNSHAVDFFIHRDNELLTVDVKTASKPTYEYMMLPESQFIKAHCSFYVAVRLENVFGHVKGYAEAEDFELLDISTLKIRTMGVRLDRLRDINELLGDQPRGQHSPSDGKT